jgi:glycogen synthase
MLSTLTQIGSFWMFSTMLMKGSLVPSFLNVIGLDLAMMVAVMGNCGNFLVVFMWLPCGDAQFCKGAAL